jgi:hypothetical protein
MKPHKNGRREKEKATGMVGVIVGFSDNFTLLIKMT